MTAELMSVPSAGWRASGERVKPAIVVSIPLVWGVRNVLRSGLCDVLARDFHLLYAVPAEGRASLLAEGIREEDVWELERPTGTRLHRYTRQLVRSAHRWRSATVSDEIFDAWRTRGSNVREALRDVAFRTAGRMLSPDPLFERLERIEQICFERTVPPRVMKFLRERQPVLGLSTSCVLDWERPLFEGMRALGIPTMTHILSFDNLTSRGYVPLKYFDHYLVWQDRMARELKEFYGIGERDITVTGTPQFDFHVRDEFRWSRARTMSTLDLGEGTRYFVYCANHAALTPREPELVERVIAETSLDERLRRHRWVVRLHPMDRYARWESLRARTDRVTFSIPWQHRDDAAYWAVPSRDDLALLGNTLRYADATVNIASTVALDSAIVDTPIVCLGFHPDKGSSEDTFYYSAHYSHHYRPITDSGAIRLAYDMDSVRESLVEAVDERAALGAARARLTAELCGETDGHSAQRIAATLREYAAYRIAAPNSISRDVVSAR